MSELRAGDEVEVFGQRASVEGFGDATTVKLRAEHWWGFFSRPLITKIEPPPPEPQVGEVWEHVNGIDKLFFYDQPGAMQCINSTGRIQLWTDVKDKHYYSKVEA